MREDHQTGVLFVSLGARAMTPEYVDLLISRANRDCSRCVVMLLDVAEETNLRVLEGLSEEQVSARVRSYCDELTAHVKERWRSPQVTVTSLSSSLNNPLFVRYREALAGAYTADRSFRSAIHNQTYQNLQPILNRRGAKNSRAEIVPELAPYLLLELAYKLFVANEGIAGVEYAAACKEMHICDAIYAGDFECLKQYTGRRLAYVGVEGDLILEKISYGYNSSRLAVQDISLLIRNGASYAIVGPNGSGKTTLLKIIAGHSTQLSGTLSWGGMDITGLRPGERPTVTVFQDYALFPHMTALQNVAFGLRYKRGYGQQEADRAATEWLNNLNVDPRLNCHLPAELSGGDQQRVAIARALALRPSILLLDEPTAALDVRQRTNLGGMLRGALDSGWIHTLIVVSHDSDFAAEVCDEVALLFEGRLLYQGQLHDLYDHPPTAQAAEQLGCFNVIRGTISADGRFTDEHGEFVFMDSSGSLAPTGTYGEKAALIVHRKDMALGDEGQELTPSFLGKVTEVTDLGGFSVVEVTTARGRRLKSISHDLRPPDLHSSVRIGARKVLLLNGE